MKGVVVESTYNWYWLVDGLMDEGYQVHLANPWDRQYEGLKQVDDKDPMACEPPAAGDPPYRVHLSQRGTTSKRSPFKRLHLVRHRTSHILSIKNILARSLGITIKSDDVKKLRQP